MGPSIVRTVVPLIVGWLLSLPLAAPILEFFGTTPEQAEPKVAGALTVALAGLYYIAARILERKWPQLGVLLGNRAQPQYVDPVTGKQVTESPAGDAGQVDIGLILLIAIFVIVLLIFLGVRTR